MVLQNIIKTFYNETINHTVVFEIRFEWPVVLMSNFILYELFMNTKH